jgi:enoyl ACP reductase
MSGLLHGKRLLITGVLTDDSLAFPVAELAQKEGAKIVLTGAGRGISLTRRVARRLPDPPDVLELDVTVPEHIAAVAADLEARWGALDGVLHSIGFAPAACLGGGFLNAGWDDVKVALEVSAFSLKSLTAGLRPLLVKAGGGAVVGLDFDARVAWPGYDWMGVAKAALESTSRYLARDLGPDHIRVNLVAAGPVRTVAAKSIPGFSLFEGVWDQRAPLGWDITDSGAVAKACVALLSDWFPMTTGEMVHVDGGFHAMGV